MEFISHLLVFFTLVWFPLICGLWILTNSFFNRYIFVSNAKNLKCYMAITRHVISSKYTFQNKGKSKKKKSLFPHILIRFYISELIFNSSFFENIFSPLVHHVQTTNRWTTIPWQTVCSHIVVWATSIQFIYNFPLKGNYWNITQQYFMCTIHVQVNRKQERNTMAQNLPPVPVDHYHCQYCRNKKIPSLSITRNITRDCAT